MAIESNQHPNQNGSRVLSAVTALTFIVGIFLPLIFGKALYHAGFLLCEVILLAGTVVTAKIGIDNTFETNDDWKTAVQVASAFANIIVPGIFIAVTNGGF